MDFSWWNLENVDVASKILRKPPTSVQFENEYHMKQVYSLIYEVFRYKRVFKQVLEDVCFYAHYPSLRKYSKIVLLLLFGIFGRYFQKPGAEIMDFEKQLFEDLELENIAKSLWKKRIDIGVAISRLRIKNKVLHISELLANCIQSDMGPTGDMDPVVTGWMNPFKIRDKTAFEIALRKLGLIKCNDYTSKVILQPKQYKWDKDSPLFLSCIPENKMIFVQSELVQNNWIILQNRTYAVAPSILSRLLEFFDLEGDIVQTHISSPKFTAYLAALFYSVNNVHAFLAFGAEQHFQEFTQYFKNLGADNVRLYAENFSTLPLESPILKKTVAMFATPPNTCSGVKDPVDLICSRGGDLTVLKVLNNVTTECKIDNKIKSRVDKILEEQKTTLRLCMSRPQVQFVLYETYSKLQSENDDMVYAAVKEVNQSVLEMHFESIKSPTRLTTDHNSSRSTNIKMIGDANKSAVEQGDNKELQISLEQLPITEEFLIADFPDICLNMNICVNLPETGCFVSLVRRKQITKLNLRLIDSRKHPHKNDSGKRLKKNSIRLSDKRYTADGVSVLNKIRIKMKNENKCSLSEKQREPTQSNLYKAVSARTQDQVKCLAHNEGCNHAGDYVRSQKRSNNTWKHPEISKQEIETLNNKNQVINLENVTQKCEGINTVKDQILPSGSVPLKDPKVRKSSKEVQFVNERKNLKLKIVDPMFYPVAINSLDFKDHITSRTNQYLKRNKGFRPFFGALNNYSLR